MSLLPLLCVVASLSVGELGRDDGVVDLRPFMEVLIEEGPPLSLEDVTDGAAAASFKSFDGMTTLGWGARPRWVRRPCTRPPKPP